MEFQPWPKTARYFRDIVVTEKIDGTNAAIHIEEYPYGSLDLPQQDNALYIAGPADVETGMPDREYLIGAQSRKRLITPVSDNFGFAAWVAKNADSLVADLGPGTHFGEWWGQGIQRRYGVPQKYFSLFNTSKWEASRYDFKTPGLRVVPVLYVGPHSQGAIEYALHCLREEGSNAALDEGVTFMNPEGVCIFHTAANSVMKVTLEDDESPKSAVA